MKLYPVKCGAAYYDFPTIIIGGAAFTARSIDGRVPREFRITDVLKGFFAAIIFYCSSVAVSKYKIAGFKPGGVDLLMLPVAAAEEFIWRPGLLIHWRQALRSIGFSEIHRGIPNSPGILYYLPFSIVAELLFHKRSEISAVSFHFFHNALVGSILLSSSQSGGGIA